MNVRKTAKINKVLFKGYLIVLDSGRSRSDVWGGAIKLGGSQNVFICIKSYHKKVVTKKAKKVTILLPELCDHQGNNHSLKTRISFIHKKFEASPKRCPSVVTALCSDAKYRSNRVGAIMCAYFFLPPHVYARFLMYMYLPC